MAQQQSFLDNEPEQWELDAAQERTVATVLLSDGPSGEFDYLVPPQNLDPSRLEQLVEPGRRLGVPFGRANRRRAAYCVGVGVKRVDPARLKSVAAVLDAERLLSPAMLELTHWMSRYYLCPWGQVLEAVLPSGVRQNVGTREVAFFALPLDVRERLPTLKLPPKQRKCVEVLAAVEEPITAVRLTESAGCTMAPVTQLLKKGLVEKTTKRVATDRAEEEAVPRERPLQLNLDQQAALDEIHTALESREATGLVLHGVTGSGKTEVYLQAIQRVVEYGRQAIVLVPEISLTPQTVRRFRARFDRIAVLHSHQSEVQRHDHWRCILRGEVQVVVGARSAVFAPARNLGLIVIDEEHEATFKQDTSPRYHARDVAWQRAAREGVPLVLGSATPSMESWHRASTGEYRKLSLPKRVANRPMPDVAIVDLRDPGQARGGRGGISRPLHQATQAALRDGGQVIYLLNRRGFSTHVQCPACGFKLECPHCELSLTYHRQDNTALCHYCDYRAEPPTKCPDCKSDAIRYGGLGTQKLEAEVRARFPDYKCARMDTDSMRGAGAHERVLSAFRRGEIDILLGTQMIAKGLDFPNVTLVGVINADTALHLPDFRAGERTFQLVAQVAGRTGRGDRGGRVLVQTLSPDHPAIVAAARHDFPRFAEAELVARARLKYPPLGAMVRIVLRGEANAVVRESAKALAGNLKADASETRVMGPAPAAIPKLRGEYRYQVQLQGEAINTVRDLTHRTLHAWHPPESVTLTVDIDPQDML
ncbi:MAG: primosomal protein N' [Planctomycetota bacterium]